MSQDPGAPGAFVGRGVSPGGGDVMSVVLAMLFTMLLTMLLRVSTRQGVQSSILVADRESLPNRISQVSAVTLVYRYDKA